MKILIFILMALPILVTSQTAKETAPFGGNLIENNTIMIFERSDGSELTMINGRETYLTKESTYEHKLSIPSYVSKNKISPMIYEKENGKEYITLDGRNWVRYDANKLNTTSVENQNVQPKNMYLVHHPQTPIENQFLVKFNLNKDSKIKFTIINLQGVILEEFEQSLPAGLNSINLNLNYLNTGTYIYKLESGNEIISKKMIKI